MGIISDLVFRTLGTGVKSEPSIAEIQGALQRLAAQREAATAAIVAATTRRRKLLLEDESDQQIAALDAEVEAQHLLHERLDEAEPVLLRQLETARDVVRPNQWAEFRRQYDEAAIGFAAAARTALESFERLNQIGTAARSMGFETEATHSFATPPAIGGGCLLNGELLDRFETECERIREGAQPSAQPVPVAKVTKAEPARSATKPAEPAKPAPRSAPRPKRARIVDARQDGKELVAIVRDGYEDPAGRSCGVGDVIALPSDIAHQVVQAGAADFVSREAR